MANNMYQYLEKTQASHLIIHSFLEYDSKWI